MKSVGAGAAFRISLYILLPSITLLDAITNPADPKKFVLILVIGLGIPVAVFGVWLEVKSILRRARAVHERTVD
jgi:predicted permease